MSSSLSRLTTSAPSGRSTPVFIDYDDYAVRVLRQGKPIPWPDLAALTEHVGQVMSLLRADAVWVDVAALYAAHLEGNAGVVEAMGAKTRAGYALRTLLGHEETAETVASTIRTLAQSARRPVLLDLPSPGRWVARAHAAAGTALDEVGPDQADSGSMYMAEWLGRLGSVDVALLLLDATPGQDDPNVVAENLEDYTSITNVAGHFGWDTALRDGATVRGATTDVRIDVLTDDYWTTGTEVPQAAALITHIPAEAQPEEVLSRIDGLG